MNTSSIKQLAADAVAFIESHEAREQELAAAAEQLSQDPAVQAAFNAGIQHERGRVLTLISIQLDLLSRGGLNALVLGALSRQIREAQS
jgi:hypothetical protein